MTTEKPFSEPRQLAINRVVTRGGDSGQTSLAGGQRVDKHSARVEAYGTVDELNTFVGAARQTICEVTAEAHGLSRLGYTLRRVQHELFNLGSLLATLPQDLHPRQARIQPEDVARLEGEIERCNAELPALRSFVLPGGSRLNAQLHQCRTICRRAERRVIALTRAEEVDPMATVYLNRLADAFFVWSRWAIAVEGKEEQLWDPNAPGDSTDGL
jgi:cob(I)alamin adenosyltransferase